VEAGKKKRLESPRLIPRQRPIKIPMSGEPKLKEGNSCSPSAPSALSQPSAD